MINKLKTPVAVSILLIVIACGSDGEGPPRASQDAQLANSPLLDGGQTLAIDLAVEIQAGPAKEFPSELRDEAQELPADEVVQLWNDFLTNTYVVDISGAVTEYCSDHTGARLGTVLEFVNKPGRVFEELRTSGAFQWSIEPPVTSGKWNQPVLREDFNSKSLTIPDGHVFEGWAFSTNRLAVFENPVCGAPYINPASARVVALWEQYLTPEDSEEPTTLRPKSFPSELMPDSQPLPWDEVVELWTEYRSDTLMIEDAGLVMEFCRGGTGNTLSIAIHPEEQPEPFEWSFHHNRGHPWYEPRFVIRDTGARIQLHNVVAGPPVAGYITGPDPHVAAHIFEHPTCGEVVPDYSKIPNTFDGEDVSQAGQCARQPFVEGCD